MTRSSSLAHRGRAGVGALPGRSASIPTFPRKGKE
jgi:hypothetical protein